MNLEEVKRIYNNMVDERSKHVFLNRILYNITLDSHYILNISEVEVLNKILCSNKKVYIFGAGEYGKRLVRFFYMMNWKCFVDNYAKEQEIEGLKVLTIDELKKEYYDDIIVISSTKYYEEMYQQLLKEGFKAENILNVGKSVKESIEKQYFEFWVDKNKKESFVDAGCFDGGSTKGFIKWCDGNYSNIWAFEPDNKNYEKCKKELEKHNCKVYNMGTYSQDGVISFNSGLIDSSNIDTNGDTQIRITKLDTLLKNEKVTFIKMDVEGAELESLKGAEEIIRTQKPKLAICVYHKPEDIITIPSLLLEYNPKYKFKIRHYTCFEWETVLYAF